jgi:hypothetical protein
MFSLVPEYFYWHYRYGSKDVRVFFGNIIWFLWNFFSVGLLLRTLFVPWQRLDEHGQKGNIQSYFEAFVITTMMRFVGAFIRIIFIILGLIVVAIVSVIAFFASILWLIIPVLPLALFVLGFYFIIFS